MRRPVTAGISGVSASFMVTDTSSSTAAGLSGLVYNTAGLVAEYRREGQATWTAITLAAGTLGTWSSGGFIANGSLGGRYEIGLPNACFTSGARWVEVCLRGATNMKPVLLEFPIHAVDYQDAAGFGLSRLDVTIGSRLATAGYSTPPTAAQIRIEMDTNSTLVDDIEAQTDLIVAAPANWSNLVISGGGTVEAALIAAGLDNIMIEGINLRRALHVMAAVLAGKLAGASIGQSGSLTIKGLGVETIRVNVDYDPNGNRTGVTLTLPG